jgi:hypothetical protein
MIVRFSTGSGRKDPCRAREGRKHSLRWGAAALVRGRPGRAGGGSRSDGLVPHRPRGLPDRVPFHVLAFMKDAHYLDLLVSIPEEDHVGRDWMGPNPLPNLRTVRPDLAGCFREQLAPHPDSSYDLRGDDAARCTRDVGRDLGHIATGRQRKPDGSQAASERSAFRISSNTSSAEVPSPRSSSSAPTSMLLRSASSFAFRSTSRSWRRGGTPHPLSRRSCGGSNRR